MKCKITVLLLGCTLIASAVQCMRRMAKSVSYPRGLGEDRKRRQILEAKEGRQTSWRTAAYNNFNEYCNTRKMSHGPSPMGLHAAVASGMVTFVDDQCLNHQVGVEINAKDGRGNTPLHVALITYDNPDTFYRMYRTLRHELADVNALNNKGYSPLVEAILSKASIEMLEMLLKDNANPNYFISFNGYTPLQVALVTRYLKAAKLLIGYVSRFMIDARNLGGQTALHFASIYGDAEVVAMLIAKGADANAVDREGNTPLHGASLSITKYLLTISNNPTKINTPNVYGKTALHLATEQKRLDVVYELIRFPRVDINARDYKGKTALHRNVATKSERITRILLDAGSDTNVTDYRGNTPLHLACTCANIAKMLLEWKHPPRLSARNFKGATVLHMTAEKRARDVWHVLAMKTRLCSEDRIAIVNIRDFEGNTVYHTAARFGYIGLLRALLFFSGHPLLNTRNNHGATVLHIAIANNADQIDPVLFTRFKRCGALIDTVDNDGNTLLHAAAGNSFHMTRMLLASSVRGRGGFFKTHVNTRNTLGQTPLHRAVLGSSPWSALHLLEAGANPHIPDNNGDTPFYAMLRHVVLPLEQDRANRVFMTLAALSDKDEPNLRGETAYDVFRKATNPPTNESPQVANVGGGIILRGRHKSI